MAQRSLYDLLNGEFASGNPALGEDVANPDAVVAKQRVVYNFAGKNNTQSNVWTEDNDGGAWSITNDGMFGTVTSGENDHAMIHFGDKMPFDATSSIFIASVKSESTNHQYHWFRCGLGGTGYSNNGNFFSSHGGPSWDFEFYNDNGISISSGRAQDENFHTVKIENTSTSAILSIDGILRCTDTTSLSTGKQQPIFQVWRAYDEDPSPECYIKYVECYNT